MKILNIHCHYKVNISNGKADIYEKMVFLNSNSLRRVLLDKIWNCWRQIAYL